jgi:hypothetical protein
MKIGVQTLSTYNVDTKGDTITLDLLDEAHQKFTLQMSVDQVGMLVMTLPSLIEIALKRRFRDTTFRYSYAAGACAVEQAADPNALIMTMRTTDGFGLSFTVSRDHAKKLSEALSLGAATNPTITAH